MSTEIFIAVLGRHYYILVEILLLNLVMIVFSPSRLWIFFWYNLAHRCHLYWPTLSWRITLAVAVVFFHTGDSLFLGKAYEQAEFGLLYLIAGDIAPLLSAQLSWFVL